ncbi:ThuA domain-containing protein [Paludibaculum fermentans]|uniref:ThuA domain-containing protein n=1 Tax=Paludibaculum fermentans TaxID=1473598 RepID=UPI003EBCCCE1
MRWFALLLILAQAVLAQAPAGPPKIKTLLITGGAVGGHDWKTVSPLLVKALTETGRFDVRVTEEFKGAGDETLAGYDLVVLNFYDGRNKEMWWGDRAQTALLNYVREGKGLVMYHFSTAAFDGWTEYEKMSGGNWRPNYGHHSAAHDFTVDITDANHPITKGLAKKLRQPNDELYANLRWQPTGTYHVLATAWDDHKLYNANDKQPKPGDGLNQPMLWTLEYGKGRVFGTALGHDGPAVKTPAFVTTFVRGAEWAATGSVTTAIPPKLADGPKVEEAQPSVVTPGVGSAPASDAVVLFNGKDMTGWVKKDGTPSGCKAVKGEMHCKTGAGDAYTAAKIGSAQIHLEFQIPAMPDQKGQLKGNSGVYLQSLTELQVLDGYQNPTYATGVVGAIYDQYPPLVNASRKPGEWSSYDIVVRLPKCKERKQQLEPGYVTLHLNGVLVQDRSELRFRPGMCEAAPLMLQDHSGFPGAPDTTMKFRNLWYRPLE